MTRRWFPLLALAVTAYLAWRLVLVVQTPSLAAAALLTVELLAWIGFGAFLLRVTPPSRPHAAQPEDGPAPAVVVAVLGAGQPQAALERSILSLDSSRAQRAARRRRSSRTRRPGRRRRPRDHRTRLGDRGQGRRHGRGDRRARRARRRRRRPRSGRGRFRARVHRHRRAPRAHARPDGRRGARRHRLGGQLDAELECSEP